MPKITTEQQQATRSFIEQVYQNGSLEELYNFVNEQFEGLDNTELKNKYGDLTKINKVILDKYDQLVQTSPRDHKSISLDNAEFKKFIDNCSNAYQSFEPFKKFIENIFDSRKDQINLYYEVSKNMQNEKLKQIQQTYADIIKKHKYEKNQTLQQLDQELQDLLKAIKLEEQSSKLVVSKKSTKPTTHTTAKQIRNKKKKLVKLQSKLRQSLEKVEHKLMELDVVEDPANLATLQSIEATLNPNAEHGADLKQTSRIKKILGEIANLVRPSEKAKLSHTAPYTDSRSLESEDPVSVDQVQMEMQEDDEGTKFETPPTSDDEFANADGSGDKSKRANYYKPISRSSVEPRFNPLTRSSQRNPVRPSNPLTATDPDLLRSSKSRYNPGDDVVPSERSRTLADSSITSLSRIPSTLASNATSTDSPRIAAEPAVTPPAVVKPGTPELDSMGADRTIQQANNYSNSSSIILGGKIWEDMWTTTVPDHHVVSSSEKRDSQASIPAEPTVTPPAVVKPDTPKLDSMPANISIPQPVYSLDKKLVRPFNPLTTTDPDLLQRSARRDSQANSSVTSAARRDSQASSSVTSVARRDSQASSSVTSVARRDSQASSSVTAAARRDSQASSSVTAAARRDSQASSNVTSAVRRDSQASSVASTARSGRIADENIRKSGNQIELVPLDGVSSTASFNELTQQFHHDMLTTHKTKSSKPFQFSIKKLKKWFPNKPKPGNLVFEPNKHQDSNILGNIYLIENNSNKHRSAQISKNTMEIPTAPNGEISLSSYQILSILFNNISNKKNPPQVELNVNLNLIEPEMLKNILECGSLDHRSTSKKHKKPILTIKTPLLIKEGLEPTEMTNLAIIENHNDIVTRLLAKKSRWKKFTHWVKELGSSKRSEKPAEAVIFRHGSNGSIIESPKHVNPLTIPKKRYNKE